MTINCFYSFHIKYTNIRGCWWQWCLLLSYIKHLNILINTTIICFVLLVYFLKVCLLKIIWNDIISNKIWLTHTHTQESKTTEMKNIISEKFHWIAMTQYCKEKGKCTWRHSNRNQRTEWRTEGRGERPKRRKVFEEIMAETFQVWWKL